MAPSAARGASALLSLLHHREPLCFRCHLALSHGARLGCRDDAALIRGVGAAALDGGERSAGGGEREGGREWDSGRGGGGGGRTVTAAAPATGAVVGTATPFHDGSLSREASQAALAAASPVLAAAGGGAAAVGPTAAAACTTTGAVGAPNPRPFQDG